MEPIKLTLYGQPITKKNSQQIILINGRPRIVPSKQYKKYEKECLSQLPFMDTIYWPVNVECIYYMPTRRRVDLVNLLEATCDILVAGKIVLDDCSRIVQSHDGSRVDYDKVNPRVEITITGEKAQMDLNDLMKMKGEK